MEYLVDMTISVPDPAGGLLEDEARRAAELTRVGRLLRLWALPQSGAARRTLGLWQAPSEAELMTTLRSLPLYPYMTLTLTPLYRHVNDPQNGTEA